MAEVAKGTARTPEVETALSRKYGGEQIRLLVSDEELAKQVGGILYAANKGSDSIADAVVVTADPGDITELAAAVPGVKIMPRRPISC